MTARLGPRTIALLLALVCGGLTAATLDDYGMTWDEMVFFHAGDSYVEWLRSPSLQREAIDAAWRPGRQHPPLHPTLAGLTKWLLHDSIGVSRLVGYRSSTVLFVVLLTYLIQRLSYRLYGPWASALALASFVSMPRVFFHSHLAALDYSMAAMWFLVVYSYWRGLEERRWVWITGIALGLALLTKLNAFFLCVPLGALWLSKHLGPFLAALRNDVAASRNGERASVGTVLVEARRDLWPVLVLPGLVFVCAWPWMWNDTVGRLTGYLEFHRSHFPVRTLFFGTPYRIAPWYYAATMLAISTPPIILVAALGGLGEALHPKSRRRVAVLLLVNALWPLVLVSLPGVPRYDGVRLFLTAMPFIAISASAGVLWAGRKLEQRRPEGWFTGRVSGLRFAVLLYGVAIALALLNLVRLHPYQNAYFNSLVGGTDGANRIGFDIEYWGSAYREVWPWANEAGGRFWIAVGRLDVMIEKLDGRIAPRVRFGNEAESDYAVLMNRPGKFDAKLEAYWRRDPVHVVRVGETDLARVVRIGGGADASEQEDVEVGSP